MEDIRYAIDRVSLGIKRPKLMTEEDKRNTAIHELGHAIAIHFTKGANPVSKITIIPHNDALGIT
jgi:ATP-dependent Zn protease